MEPLEMLRLTAELNASRPQMIREARKQGHKWEQIADAAGMSRAGVIKLANQTDPE